MDIALTFLGTAGAVPTPQRNLSATLLQRGSDRILVDCGEGTQRQLIRAAVGLTQIQTILLTHLHADHYLGLPGMLKTWDLWGRTDPVDIHGPRGLLDLVELLRRIIGRTDFPVHWHEHRAGDVLSMEGARLVAVGTDHRIPSLGWLLAEEDRPGRFDVATARRLGVTDGPDCGRLQRGESVTARDGRVVQPSEVLGPPRPGRRIVLTGDTRPCNAVIEAAAGADLLVHDSTFTTAEQQRAEETYHSTAREAALVAKVAGVRRLALTHLSYRHHPRDLHAEAREVFPDCVLPADLDRMIVPFPEKGAAYLDKEPVAVPS